MKNTKKVLSVALAGALAFGSVGASFAAMPVMDAKTDKKVADAVERLHAFGIVNGMEDGKYHEEMKVTREQFAKLLVEALGLGNAANAAKGATKFNDVESSRWSSGYVNVAVGQGLIKGYEDGTFRPAAEVSYAEAATMLVRALGYKDEFLKGSWPGNYVAKAAEVKITNNAKFDDVSGKADRGTVALLVDNTLDAKVVKVDTYEGGTVKYKESDVSLLEDKLDIKEYTDVRLVGNERLKESLDSNELEFKATKNDVNFAGKEIDKGDSQEIEIVKGLSTDELMGLKVKVYVNDDDEVVFMKRDGSENIALDIAKSVDAAKKEVELLELDDTYSTANGVAYVAKGGAKVDTGNAYDKIEANMIGRFVIENNEVVFADTMAPDVNGLIVKTVNTDTQELTGILSTDDNETINLKDDYDKVIIKDSNGKALELKDIKANNVVYVVKSTIDGDDYAVVTVVQNNEIKGKLGSIKSDEIKITDKSYDLVTGYNKATFSINNDKDIYEYSVDDKKLEDADEKEIVAITDIVGNILHFTTDAKTTSDDVYGVVTKKFTESESLKVYLPKEDKEVTYKLEELDDLAVANAGDFIKFSLNKNGEIADGEISVASTLYTIAGGANAEFGKNSIKTDAGILSVGSDSIFMSETAAGNNQAVDVSSGVADDDNLDLVNWSDIKEDKIATDIYARAFVDSTGEIEAMIFLDNGVSGASDDEQSGYILDSWKKGEDTIVKIELFDGGIKEFKLDSGTVVDENAYVIKVKSNGKIELVAKDAGSTADFDIISGFVTGKDGSYVKVVNDLNNNGVKDAGETEEFYKTSDSSVIYKEDTKKRLSNVTTGAKVDIVIEEGRDARVIEIK